MTRPSGPDPSDPKGGETPRLAVIACRVLEDEIKALAKDASHVVRSEFFDVGLHDQPTRLRTLLASAIDRAEADRAVERVVLVYGLCGLALVDLASRRCPLVVARAHDCITLLLGSKERYAAIMSQHPGTYWYSPGWNRAGRVPGPEREALLRAEYTEKFGAESAEALMEMERESLAQHTTAGYSDLGMASDETSRCYAEKCAKGLGWGFQNHAGDPRLLRDLLYGPWDSERFLVVQPGERVAHSPDSKIMKAVGASAPQPPPCREPHPSVPEDLEGRL